MGKTLMATGLILLITFLCVEAIDWKENAVSIPTFHLPETIKFAEQLSAYQLFTGSPAALTPAPDCQLLELSSVLFTDYAHKQRLVKVPKGTKMTRVADGTIAYPDGTILAKTFFYQNDERDPRLGRRIIETRLEIKEKGQWNIATYLWNEAQTDATLALEGADTQVEWVSADGIRQSTRYHVPSQNECVTCHQSQTMISPIGPSLRNLNRMVERNGTSLNQLAHLQAVGLLDDFELSQVAQIVDYRDPKVSLSERGRAYLDLNCAHCHNPNGWQRANQRPFDFRYETPLSQTSILSKKDKIMRTLLNRRMPFIGTTMLDEEGIHLMREYLNSR